MFLENNSDVFQISKTLLALLVCFLTDKTVADHLWFYLIRLLISKSINFHCKRLKWCLPVAYIFYNVNIGSHCKKFSNNVQYNNIEKYCFIRKLCPIASTLLFVFFKFFFITVKLLNWTWSTSFFISKVHQVVVG